MYLYEFIDPVDFQWVFDTHQNIHGKKVSYPDLKLDTLQNIVYIEKENVVLATFYRHYERGRAGSPGL